jgi:hypothetical protein
VERKKEKNGGDKDEKKKQKPEHKEPAIIERISTQI